MLVCGHDGGFAFRLCGGRGRGRIWDDESDGWLIRRVLGRSWLGLDGVRVEMVSCLGDVGVANGNCLLEMN